MVKRMVRRFNTPARNVSHTMHHTYAVRVLSLQKLPLWQALFVFDSWRGMGQGARVMAACLC